MIMDFQFTAFPSSDYGVNFPFHYQNLEIPSGIEFNEQFLGFNSINAGNFESPSSFEFNEQSLGFNSMDVHAPVAASLYCLSNPASFSSLNEEGSSGSPFSDIESRNSVIEYLGQVLMEEDMEEQPCMYRDELALQATEKSLYEVLGEIYPEQQQQQQQASLCGDESVGSLDYHGGFSHQNSFGRLSCSSSSSIDPPWNVDLMERDGRPVQTQTQTQTQTPIPANIVSESTLNSSWPSTNGYQHNSSGADDGVLESSFSDSANPNRCLQEEWALQFNKGVQEASKFLPKVSHLSVTLKDTFEMNVMAEQETLLTGKRNHERCGDEELEETRNNKQLAVSVDENELLELFDAVVISPRACDREKFMQERARMLLEQKEQTNGSSGGKTRGKKKGDRKKVIDVRTLLIFCAQAVSSNDLSTAKEHLKQIRRHSSRIGDGYQRLAHVFSDALEARIDGTGTQIYTALSSKGRSTFEILKAYQLYISACPFQRSAIIFANRSIMAFMKEREKETTTLHIIDFGIFYGFQWPGLIMRFLEIHGGSLKLRITGIDNPMPGFRPTEAVEETGRRLARYCERFNVPFEYNGIAKPWETITVEDLNLRPNEVVVANCLYRLHYLLDDTVVMDNPRDAVLNLIRKINPDMFIHSIVNGSYRTPFFLTRFKDVLFHYSSLFDMFDSRIPRDDKVRVLHEQVIFKREVMNVVACEGTKRILRPESYKQWQVRITRAGFRQRDLDNDLLSKLRSWMKDEFQDHGEFTMETDGQWMLQGWKGRILFASSIWLPA